VHLFVTLRAWLVTLMSLSFRYAMAKDFMKAIGKEIKQQKFIVPISLYPQKKGFVPPNPDRDWTSKFKGSISQARQKFEKGDVTIPAGGVFVQSRRLSTEKGYPVFYHIMSTDDSTVLPTPQPSAEQRSKSASNSPSVRPQPTPAPQEDAIPALPSIDVKPMPSVPVSPSQADRRGHLDIQTEKEFQKLILDRLYVLVHFVHLLS